MQHLDPVCRPWSKRRGQDKMIHICFEAEADGFGHGLLQQPGMCHNLLLVDGMYVQLNKEGREIPLVGHLRTPP